MSVTFFNDQVARNDSAGMGVWLTEHFYEHNRFWHILAARTPPVLIPDWPLIEWKDDKLHRREWLDVHERVHDALRAQAGITGVDLGIVDFDQDSEFYGWLDLHASEHSQLRQIFGAV